MNKFTAIIHRGEPDEGGFWATCLEVPGANGQGENKQDCLDNLVDAIRELLKTRPRHVPLALITDTDQAQKARWTTVEVAPDAAQFASSKFSYKKPLPIRST